MSESILNALIHLFALIANVNYKQVSERSRKVVLSYLQQHLEQPYAEEYLKLFDDYFDFYSRELREEETGGSSGSTMLKFQVTNVCNQINRDLHQNDKLIVFLRLLEFVNDDNFFSEPDLEFIQTVAGSFSISPAEVGDAKAFILEGSHRNIDPKNLLIVRKPKKTSVDDLEGAWIEEHMPRAENDKNIIERESLKGRIIVMLVRSTDLFVFRYTGHDELHYEGKPVLAGRFYILNRGGSIKGKNIEPVYYSEISAKFFQSKKGIKIVLTAHGIEYRYPLSQNGLRPFSFSVESGQMIGVMGISGSGKSTLLNILNGKIKPDRGRILINSFDIHREAERIEGQIGYVPQDDLLIEELTVFQNLYYSAKLSFGNLKEEKVIEIVDKVLSDLGLDEIRDLQVGNPLKKFISGGQRKRLNIGLELLREPSVLFIDEPTSGLSSLDSDVIMALLKEQAMKGKLVIANIHQPSSDNFKLLDQLWIIDKGGYPVYRGNPLEALAYFKKISGHINPGQTECNCCGNVPSEQILKIIEAKEISRTGHHTLKRKVQPQEWYKHYQEKIAKHDDIKTGRNVLPPNLFSLPGVEKQFMIFSIRNFLSKISNRQYLMVSLLEAPVLAFILGYFTKYLHEGGYVFSENVNLPSFLFMSVVVSLFLGLSLSADEIIKDRRILERESFLHLSWFSYLTSKVGWVFLVSAIQMITFVIIGNFILEIRGMTLTYFLVLFSTACFANMLGLFISSAFNSVVTIYILVPFLLVPQLLLGGVVVKFDELHDSLTDKINVPLVGDLMASRWAFEALAVEQFARNRFQRYFFEYEQINSDAGFKSSFLIPRLQAKVETVERLLDQGIADTETEVNLNILRNEIEYLQYASGLMPFEYINNINIDEFDPLVAEETIGYLIYMRMHFSQEAREASADRDRVFRELESELGSGNLHRLRQGFHNRALADLVLNRHEIEVIHKTNERLVQKKDPIYKMPESNIGRAHFYASVKRFNNEYVDTLWFNLSVIWLMTLILYLIILIDLPRKIARLTEIIRLRK
jgi:ABC transport system ATP-binding/permease protein